MSACTLSPTTPSNLPSDIPLLIATPDQIDSLSPDNIAHRIQKQGFIALEDVWQALGINSPDYLFKQKHELTFNVQRLYTGVPDSDDEYVMVIANEEDFRWDWQYLIFKSDGT